MDSKFYFIKFLILFLVHLSSQCDEECEMWPAAVSHVNYYINIKTSVDLQSLNREDTQGEPWRVWRNDSIFENGLFQKCKVRFNGNDNFYLYLFKNETSTLHGPIRIDPKHVELDMKFNLTKEARDKYSDNIYYMEFELNLIKYARCVLMYSAYKMFEDFPASPPPTVNLELDSETASLFPKIEKDDYFIMHIINFAERITLATEKTEELPEGLLLSYDPDGANNWNVATHNIFNFTIVSPKLNEI